MLDHDLNLDTAQRCPVCDGDGWIECKECDLGWRVKDGKLQQCATCNGCGYVTCPRCHGSGKMEDSA
jgi:DnaJ-class molecular chaperone